MAKYSNRISRCWGLGKERKRCWVLFKIKVLGFVWILPNKYYTSCGFVSLQFFQAMICRIVCPIVEADLHLLSTSHCQKGVYEHGFCILESTAVNIEIKYPGIHTCVCSLPPLPPHPFSMSSSLHPASKLVVFFHSCTKRFFVNQSICPSLFGVQTVVWYPVTDPACCEWQFFLDNWRRGQEIFLRGLFNLSI